MQRRRREANERTPYLAFLSIRLVWLVGIAWLGPGPPLHRRLVVVDGDIDLDLLDVEVTQEHEEQNGRPKGLNPAEGVERPVNFLESAVVGLRNQIFCKQKCCVMMRVAEEVERGHFRRIPSEPVIDEDWR